jgi:hypothetical protein
MINEPFKNDIYCYNVSFVNPEYGKHSLESIIYLLTCISYPLSSVINTSHKMRPNLSKLLHTTRNSLLSNSLCNRSSDSLYLVCKNSTSFYDNYFKSDDFYFFSILS